MKRCRVFLLGGMCCLLASVGNIAMAAQSGDSLSVTFTGTFNMVSPCTINNDEVIDVYFGNIGIDKVDGINYIQDIPYTVECNGAADDTAMQLSINGSAATFDDAAVVTNAEGLAIQFQENGQPLALNKPLSMSLGALPTVKLRAVPVKAPSAILSAQVFTAVATLAVSYE